MKIAWWLRFLFAPMYIVEEGGGGTDVVLDPPPDAAPPADAAPKVVVPAAPEAPTVEGAVDAIRQGLQMPPEKPAAPVVETDPAKKLVADEAAAKAKADEDARVKSIKVDDIKLTDQERAAISPKANERFHDLHKKGKQLEDELARVTAAYEGAARASTALTTILQDTKTEPKELGELLDYNFMLKTGKWEDALKVVNMHRANILKAMGKEEPGVDLLDDFPDLKTRVSNMELDRLTALELATNRRKESQRQAQEREAGAKNETVTQQRQQEDIALDAIDQWCAAKAKEDASYKLKELKVTPRIAEIMKKYPPNQWLPTIQLVYDSIAVDRAPPSPPPLRANSVRPGAKAPGSMLDAINNGLGYTPGS